MKIEVVQLEGLTKLRRPTVEKLRGRLEAINFEAELQNEVILLEGVFHTSEHALGDCAISDHEIIFTERL